MKNKKFIPKPKPIEAQPTSKLPLILSSLLYVGLFIALLIPENRLGTISDYFLAMSQSISNRLYFLKNGFFSIPYYSPVIGAGLPMYADPTASPVSIIQFFINIMPNPYLGLKISLLICLLLSHLGCFLLLRKFGMNTWLASVGGIVFSLNGGILMRWFIGHIIFHTYWVIPWVMLMLHDIAHEGPWRRKALCSIAVAFFVSVSLYGSDIQTLYTLALLIPTFLLSLKLSDWKSVKLKYVFQQLLVMAPFFLGFIASRALMITDYLKLFPRKRPNDIISIDAVLWVIPNCLFNPKWKMSSLIPFQLGGWHEYGNYIGMVPALCLVVGLVLLIFKTKSQTTHPAVKPLLIWFGITLVFVALLIKGDGGIWDLLKGLPLLASFHAASRFLECLPICTAALALALLNDYWASKKNLLLVAGLCLFAIGDVVHYSAANYLGMKPDLIVDYAKLGKDTKITHWEERAGGFKLEQGIADTFTHTPQFGNIPYSYNVDPTKPALFENEDGTYNLRDPVSMIYPKYTGRPPFSRLPIEGNQEAALKFLNFEDPGFYVPFKQKFANMLSLITLLLAISFAVYTRYEKQSQNPASAA